ncbi:hypothetical protein DGG96_09410 [Legionella qingyii]|uniref:Uncharacterized protein n=1 Tax=Legionella qingyii TaxID=2184757 RepID=A0A317U621_9GAMM|nr:hypothetical protein DGG96_09410 [Legionella qingyii]
MTDNVKVLIRHRHEEPLSQAVMRRFQQTDFSEVLHYFVSEGVILERERFHVNDHVAGIDSDAIMTNNPVPVLPSEERTMIVGSIVADENDFS